MIASRGWRHWYDMRGGKKLQLDELGRRYGGAPFSSQTKWGCPWVQCFQAVLFVARHSTSSHQSTRPLHLPWLSLSLQSFPCTFGPVAKHRSAPQGFGSGKQLRVARNPSAPPFSQAQRKTLTGKSLISDCTTTPEVRLCPIGSVLNFPGPIRQRLAMLCRPGRA